MEVGSHKLLFENLNSTPIHSILWTVLHKHGLRDRYGAALKENELQEAFDEIWPTWFSEMAAMIYAEVLSVLDLLLLTSVLDNRREIKKLKDELGKVLCT